MARPSILLLFITAASMFLPASTFAAARWSLIPRVYVQGQYDDNIFLDERNEQTDFITTISPGVRLNYEDPTGGIYLDYEFQRVLHNDFPDLDFSGHRGTAEARKDFSKWFGAGIREIFIRSEDPIELTGAEEFERPSIRAGRNRYTRNIVEPEATFRFGENRSIQVGYRNNILRNKREDLVDLDENAVNTLLTFRFDIRNGVEVFYEHINQEYQETVPPTANQDFYGDEIRGRYTHYLDPQTSAFLEYRYYQRDFDTEPGGSVDYKVHDPRVGFSRDLYQDISLSASAGYAIQDPEGRKSEETFSGRGDLSAAYKRLTLSLYGETGFGEDFTSAESLGFNEFWRAGFNARYQLLERLLASGFFYIERNRFKDIDRSDTLWITRGSVSYQVLRWLFVSFDYEHNARGSTIDGESYRDNRYMGRLTVQHDIAEHFQ